jgi:hypothetical protein
VRSRRSFLLASLRVWIGRRSAFGMGAVSCALQGEKPGAAPGRAGNGARDRRQAGIRASLPVEALTPDSDGVALALVLANQNRAGFELATARAALAREAVEERQTDSIKTAEGPLLQTPGDHATEQVPAQTGGGWASEFCPSASPKYIERKRADASDLGRYRGFLGQRLAHGYALAGAELPGSQAGRLPPVIW